MAITSVGYDVEQENSGLTTITMLTPFAGTLAGDIMVCAVGQSGGQPAPTFPAGWTTWDDVSWSGDRFTVKWKRAAANEPNFDVSNITAISTIGFLAVYRGCKASGDPANAHSLTTGAATTTVSFPSVATGAAGAMVFLVGFWDPNSNSSAPTGTDPTVVNEMSMFGDGSMWDALTATGNATGARTISPLDSARATVGWSLALANPNPAGSLMLADMNGRMRDLCGGMRG